MNMYTDQKLIELRRQDMMRQTAEFRRVQATKDSNEKTGLHRPVLARLGRIMSKIGHALQTRYDKNRDRQTEPYQYKSA